MALQRLPAALLSLALAALLLAAPADAAKKKKPRGKKPRAKPVPTAPPAPVYYGPPAPPQPIYLRAAGAAVLVEPGHFLVLAEVGATGRVFRIDPKTEFVVTPRAGDRIRVLYVDEADGPVARKVLPGPVDVAAPTPTPRA